MSAPVQIKATELSSLQKEYAKHQKSFSLKKGTDKAPRILTECTSDTGLLNGTAKLLKNVFTYPAKLVSEVPFDNVVKHCGAFSDTFKALGFFSGIKKVRDNSLNQGKKGIDLHARNLGIASGVFQTIIGAATFTKLLDTFGALKIAAITNAMGASSVVGQALAVALPFTAVTNFLEIGKNIVDIASASIRIHQNRKTYQSIQAKVRQFNTKNPDQIGPFMSNHIANMESKQIAAITNLDNKENEIQKTSDHLVKVEKKYQDKKEALDAKIEAVKNSHAVVRFFKILAPRLQTRQARLRVFDAKENHDKECQARQEAFKKWEGRAERIEAWTKINQNFTDNGLSNDANDPLCQLIAAKQNKWKVKKSGLDLKNLQEGIGITINLLATITLIASTVLFFSGVGTLPAILGLTSIFLIISVLGLGNELFKKYKKPKIVKVDVTSDKFAPAAA